MRPDGLATLAASVTPSDFFRHGHRRIFEAMLALAGRCTAIDTLTVADALRQSGDLEDAGGPAYVAGLVDGLPRSTNVAAYAVIVREYAARRRLMQIGRSLSSRAATDDASAAVLAREHIAELQGEPSLDIAGGRLLVDDAALAHWPAPLCVFSGALTLPQGGLAVLIGAPGAGKSTLAAGLAVATAAGRPAIGVRIDEPGPVVIVATEAGYSTARRILAAKLAFGLDTQSAIGVHLWTEPIDLSGGDEQRLIAATREMGPRLIVIDVWGGAIGDADENGAGGEGIRPALRALRALREETGAAVIVVHHLGATGQRERGSTALRAEADVCWRLDPADDLLTLSTEKSRDLPPSPDLQLRLRAVPEIRGAVIALADDAAVDVGQLSTTQERVLALIRSVADGLTASAVAEALPSLSKRSIYRALEALTDARAVTKSGQRYRVSGLSL